MDDCVIITNDEARTLIEFLEFHLKKEMATMPYDDLTEEEADHFFDSVFDLSAILKRCKEVVKDG